MGAQAWGSGGSPHRCLYRLALAHQGQGVGGGGGGGKVLDAEFGFQLAV